MSRELFLGGLVIYAPLLIAAGVLIALALTGKTRWSRPRCRGCGRDLGGLPPDETPACPGCAADLTGRKAVRIERHGRRWRLLALAVALLLMPLGALGAAYGLERYRAASGPPGSHNLGQKSTPVVIGYTLQHIDQPWGWQELGRRAEARELTAADVDRVIQALIAHFNAAGPGSSPPLLHWIDSMLDPAEEAGLLTNSQLVDLTLALHGRQPTITALPHPWGVSLRIDYGHGNHPRLGALFLRRVKSVTIDGEPITAMHHHTWGRSQTSYILEVGNLAPGTHEMVVELDLAIVREEHTVGLDTGRPPPPEEWPPALKRWTASEKATLTLAGPAAQP